MPLTRSFNLFQSCLLEASAGTGKTFTISHLFIRFLLEKVPLDKILVVTFTKAAVSELKGRIRQQLRETILILEEETGGPDYLVEVDRKEARGRLKEALAHFEEAAIMTIHSFCARTLKEAGLLGEIPGEGEDLMEGRLLSLLDDTLMAGLEKVGLSKDELYGFDNVPDLERLSLRHLKEDKDVIHTFESLKSQYEKKCQAIVSLVKGENVLEQFEALIPYYNGLKNYGEALQNLATIAEEGMTFDRFVKLLYNNEPFLAINEENRNKRKKEIKKSPLFEALRELLDNPSDKKRVMAAILASVQAVKRQARYHFNSHDSLLEQMRRALTMPSFLTQVKEAFNVAIIDEFQDTDPLQWEIFAACFVSEKPCFLVGDPKQSIYSFRKADVYTYLEAAALAGKKIILNTNWRSTPALVGAFNALFSGKCWLTLPKTAGFLEAPILQAGREGEEPQGDKGAVHFMLLQGERTKRGQELRFFEEIAAEMTDYNEAAVLVSDRSQAKRLERFFKERGIPTANWQKLHKDDDESDLSFRMLLEALLRPDESGLIKAALMTPLFNWSHEEVLSDAFSGAQEEFFALKDLWERKGFAACLTALLASRRLTRTGSLSIADCLDKTREGRKVLLETKHHAEELIEAPWMRHPHLPDQLLEHYDRRLSSVRKGDEGVNILTPHASKGLEFNVVFALCLAFGSTMTEELFTKGDKLAFADKKDPDFQLFLQEKDAEKLRQLYVAMTRAKTRLYLPYVMTDKEPIPGKAAPLSLFMRAQSASAVLPYLDELATKAKISYSFVAPRDKRPLLDTEERASLLHFPLALIKKPERQVLSFTAMAQKKESEKVEATGMPSGAHVGQLLHDILENLPWDKARSRIAIQTFVQLYLKNSPLEAWEDDVTTLIFDTFHLPLQGFTLADVDPCKVMREMEFLHKASDNYIKGYVDMAFEYKGDYYLVDWKSNLLSDYSQESLHKAMVASDYFLQAQIYRDAFCAYLKRFGKDNRFKGLFYLFLRGPAVYYVS